MWVRIYGNDFMKNGKTTILLIEDVEIDAALIVERLSIKGHFRTVIAQSLQEGLDYLSGDEYFDAILLDLTLPDSEGADTFKSIHQKVPHIPIIILTGVDDDQIVLQTLKSGAQDYLIKGQVNNHLLEKTIRYAIERKQFEEALLKSKAQLDQAMDVAQLYLWEYDVKERNFIFNEKLWAFLGNEANEQSDYKLKPEEYAEIYVYPKDRHVFENILKEAYAHEGSDYSSQFEYRIVRRDGQVRHLLVRVKAIMGTNSKPTGFFGIIQDITERKIEIQKSFEALNQVDSAKTEFLYFISQEIRTPLNGVVSAVSLIKNQENSAAVRDLVETLDKSVSNLESFTNNAVLYTKLTNNYVPELTEFKIKGLIQFALLEKENSINEKDIRIHFEESQSDLLLRGDKDLLYKLFLNILDIFISNSSFHNNIRIGFTDDTEKICCSFYDSKNRFPDDLLKSYTSVTGIYQNCQMGLSLYIVKLITDKHKGELNIFNDGDSMATAIFHFPK